MFLVYNSGSVVEATVSLHNYLSGTSINIHINININMNANVNKIPNCFFLATTTVCSMLQIICMLQ